MNIEWFTNPVCGSVHTEIAGRNVNIEKGVAGFDAWYGAPGRRICLGKFQDVGQAKTVAEDLLHRLVSLNTFLEEH